MNLLERMPNYGAPGVYIIKHKFLEEFYIGSTSNIEVRLSDHKNRFT